jgi:hypothetical protein
MNFFGKKKPTRVSLASVDIDFYQESKNLEARLRAALLALGKIANTRYHSTLVFEALGWLKPYGISDDTNFSFNVRAKGIRYFGMFTDYCGNVGLVYAAIEHTINRWKLYKVKKLTGKQMNRAVRFLESLIPHDAFVVGRTGSLAKGYTFDLRKLLEKKL